MIDEFTLHTHFLYGFSNIKQINLLFCRTTINSLNHFDGGCTHTEVEIFSAFSSGSEEILYIFHAFHIFSIRLLRNEASGRDQTLLLNVCMPKYLSECGDFERVAVSKIML